MKSHTTHRPRRLRRHPWLRDLVQEHRLDASDLIWPVFIQEGEGIETPVESLPGVARLSIDLAIKQASELHAKGLTAIALFPVTPTELKNETGDEAFNADNLICRAIRAFKAALPELGLITDVALDPYTTHGHDGLIDADGHVENDVTVAVLCKQAVVQAAAGTDIIAPSDMMDGRVGAIRDALDEAGFENVAILSYTAKYASAFYGPFRDAVGSGMTPPVSPTGSLRVSDKEHGRGQKAERAFSTSDQRVAPCESQQTFTGAINKTSYQMNPANSVEALKEATLDVAEGADMLMVKPGLPYLDTISSLKQNFDLPIFAYHVSGEYAGVMFAANAGAIDANAALMEQMLCFKRAGATAILTYAAPVLLDALSK